jgi:hypothetical protein
MHQIGRSVGSDFVTLLAQVANVGCIRIFLSRKDQNDFSPLVSERHPGGEGILARGPPYINTRLLIDPGSRLVKRLMPQDFEHAPQLRLRPSVRHLGD